jgi:hypothetical protein
VGKSVNWTANGVPNRGHSVYNRPFGASCHLGHAPTTAGQAFIIVLRTS